MKATLIQRFTDALNRIPAPGNGCHGALLGVANLGRLAGVPEDQLLADIRAAIPPGQRRVPDSEILDAIAKASAECQPLMPGAGGHNRGYRRPPACTLSAPFDGPEYRATLIRRSEGVTEAELWEASPIRIDWEPGPQDALAVLDALYRPDDILFIGDKYDKRVATVARQRRAIEAGNVQPHIAPNPVDGKEHATGSGTQSRRSDAAVCDFRFSVVEFDDIPRDSQIAFWFSIIERRLLPVAVLLDSGGKSIHAWLRVDLPDADAWNEEIRDGLYHPQTGRMALLGADRACQNPSRLSRLPGHFRREKNKMQRLLYLNPEAQR